MSICKYSILSTFSIQRRQNGTGFYRLGPVSLSSNKAHNGAKLFLTFHLNLYSCLNLVTHTIFQREGCNGWQSSSNPAACYQSHIIAVLKQDQIYKYYPPQKRVNYILLFPGREAKVQVKRLLLSHRSHKNKMCSSLIKALSEYNCRKFVWAAPKMVSFSQLPAVK